MSTGPKLINSDSIYGNPFAIAVTDTNGNLETLNNGTSGLVLTSTGTSTLPSWQTPTAATNLAGGGVGTIVYQSAVNTTAFLTLANASTNNYHLIAGATTPTWIVSKGDTVSYLTSGTTYSPPTDAVSLTVYVIGGGGGSGSIQGPNPSITGGGGGGGLASAQYLLQPVGTFSFSYTIGAGGAAGTAGGAGGNGGNSTFGNTSLLRLTAQGGGGGGGLATGLSGYTSNGGFGGVGSAGASITNPLLIQGQYGGWGGQYGSMAKGGDSPLGWGSGGVAASYSAGGTWQGFGYGAGCGGTIGSMVSTTYAGVTGQPGIVVVVEKYQ